MKKKLKISLEEYDMMRRELESLRSSELNIKLNKASSLNVIAHDLLTQKIDKLESIPMWIRRIFNAV